MLISLLFLDKYPRPSAKIRYSFLSLGHLRARRKEEKGGIDRERTENNILSILSPRGLRNPRAFVYAQETVGPEGLLYTAE